jgi:hypothetical protein
LPQHNKNPNLQHPENPVTPTTFQRFFLLNKIGGANTVGRLATAMKTRWKLGIPFTFSATWKKGEAHRAVLKIYFAS